MLRVAWNRGLTQHNHPSVRQMADTMRRKRIDNFKVWRDEMKRQGLIKSRYPALKQNGDLAELIGVILGDGHIGKFPRCESLRIVGNFDNQGFIRRYAHFVEKIFKKSPTVAKVNGSKATTITIYEREISKRLEISHGSRAKLQYVLPAWIKNHRSYLIRFLRGLYEAEGSVSHHLPTYTHKMIFSNRNQHLLDLVAREVRELGFKVNVSAYKVQVSRRNEVQKLENLLQFRRY